ncbi:hypothetical protein KR018_006794, partial [Drosophila ironensis]
FQMSSVKVSTVLGNIEFSAIYCPPRNRIDERNFSGLLAQCGHRYLIGGDWNARHWLWGDRSNSNRGHELVDDITAKGANILATGLPTRYPYVHRHTPSCIDFAVYHGIPELRVNISQNWDLDSDHVALVVSIQTKGINVSRSPRLITNRTDITAFKQYLECSFPLNSSLGSGEDIEHAVDILTETIHRAAAVSTPPNPVLHPSRYGIVLTREEQANAFGLHLEARFTPFNFATAQQISETTQNLQSPLQMSLPIRPIRI